MRAAAPAGPPASPRRSRRRCPGSATSPDGFPPPPAARRSGRTGWAAPPRVPSVPRTAPRCACRPRRRNGWTRTAPAARRNRRAWLRRGDGAGPVHAGSIPAAGGPADWPLPAPVQRRPLPARVRASAPGARSSPRAGSAGCRAGRKTRRRRHRRAVAPAARPQARPRCGAARPAAHPGRSGWRHLPQCPGPCSRSSVRCMIQRPGAAPVDRRRAGCDGMSGRNGGPAAAAPRCMPCAGAYFTSRRVNG